MRKELVVKTKTLAGVSDLTIAATIRPGLVPSLDSVTYRSRVKAVLRVLNSSRSSSHEYSLLRTFSDSVERVGQIHSVRIAVIDDKVMLAATFDGNFESYIRVLYRKVGTLLDLVFCNTVGHVGSHGCRYEQWRDWVASVLVETDMFYSTPGLSFDDVQYLQRNERLYREQGGAADLAATQLAVRSAEDRATAAVASPPPQPPGTPPGPPTTPVQRPVGHLENVKQGMQALAILYRLADWYLPGSDDGEYLQRAAQDLLLEMRALDTKTMLVLTDPGLAPVRARFAKQLAWFEGAPKRQPLPDPAAPWVPPVFDPADVQGGILGGYPADVTHGALVLLRFDGAAGAAALLTWLLAAPRLWLQSHQGAAAGASKPLVTVAFTPEGLRAAGLTDAEIERFPPEFVQGMEARCSVLGDLHLNHPRRWRLPLRNWGKDAANPGTSVEMAAVQAVVQLRVGDAKATEFDDVHAKGHPLRKSVDEVDALAGVQVLSVQAMRRAFQPDEKPKEHFGFADPVSNPQFLPPFAPATYYPNQVPLGEALLGHANQADAAPVVADPLLRNGSFLVVRKMSQDVKRFNDVATAAAAANPGLSAKDAKEKLMGRQLDGKPLAGLPVGTGGDNDFNFAADPTGAACPLQAHVRRVNPRGGRTGKAERGERPPLIVRRGMSYGPLFDRNNPAAPGNAKERGLFFMAYNASIAEQFEVVQRWLAGGNSSGISSSQSDPIVGVPQVGDARVVRFSHGQTVCRVALDHPLTATGTAGVPGPITRLEWGLYLFTPSVTALRALRQRAEEEAKAVVAAANATSNAAAKAVAARSTPWNAAQGEKLLADLMARAATLPPAEAALLWKAALEDPEERRLHRSASVWAAVRECRGGVLHTRTPYGVLVADPELVMRVFADDERRYSMAGQLERMRGGFGEIYLGLDREASTHGCEYERLSAATNAAIQQLDARRTFATTRRRTTAALGRMLKVTIEQTRAYGLPSWELNLDVKEVVDAVLADLCTLWFGVPGHVAGSTPFRSGGYRWDWTEGQPPLIPGHLTWPSRQIFQPLPGDAVTAYGTRYGQALRLAANAFVAQHRNANPPTAPKAPLSKAMFDAFPDRADDDLVARTLVGALMGFLPTVDGNLRGSLNEWLRDGTFWRLRQALGTAAPVSYADAMAAIGPALKETMQLRPTPELVWRTAVKGHPLGGVAVNAGDRVVVAIVSATQRRLEQRNADVSAVFGGVRKPATAPWGPGLPTHACPAMDPGIAVLLGMLAGLLQARGHLRPSPAPLSLTFEGKA